MKKFLALMGMIVVSWFVLLLVFLSGTFLLYFLDGFGDVVWVAIICIMAIFIVKEVKEHMSQTN